MASPSSLTELGILSYNKSTRAFESRNVSDKATSWMFVCMTLTIALMLWAILWQAHTITDQQQLIRKLYKDAWARPTTVVPQSAPSARFNGMQPTQYSDDQRLQQQEQFIKDTHVIRFELEQLMDGTCTNHKIC